jgi:hypothetical protein
VQLWEDNIPATLTDNYTGEIYNDSAFTSSAKFLLVTGHTGAFDITLTCASGASWSDNVSVRSNAKKFNNANGVSFSSSVTYDEIFDIQQNRFKLIGLQIEGSGSPARCVNGFSAAPTNTLFKNLLMRSANASSSAFRMGDSTCLSVNCTLFIDSSGGNGMHVSGGKILACDVIRASDKTAAGTAYTTEAYTSGSILQSSNSFGFSTAADATRWDTTNSKYNATNLASGLPGSTGNQYSVTYSSATPWVTATNTGCDLQPIASTSLINNGFYDATNAPTDCTGTARDATPTIGSWEYGSAPPAGDDIAAMTMQVSGVMFFGIGRGAH